MKRQSLSLWQEFKELLLSLQDRITIDTILTSTIETLVDKVERAITLEEPYSEFLEILDILGDNGYRRNIISKISKEDYELLLKCHNEYLTLVSFVRKEDNILIEENVVNSSTDKNTSIKIPKNPDVNYETLYGKNNKGEKDYLF